MALRDTLTEFFSKTGKNDEPFDLKLESELDKSLAPPTANAPMPVIENLEESDNSTMMRLPLINKSANGDRSELRVTMQTSIGANTAALDA